MAPWDPAVTWECCWAPTCTFLLQNYTEWLQELKEKGPELLKQLPVNTEPSLVSMAHILAHVGGVGVVVRGCHLLSSSQCPELFHPCVWLSAPLFYPLPSGPGLQAEGG